MGCGRVTLFRYRVLIRVDDLTTGEIVCNVDGGDDVQKVLKAV
jgi:hypothetical protein